MPFREADIPPHHLRQFYGVHKGNRLPVPPATAENARQPIDRGRRSCPWETLVIRPHDRCMYGDRLSPLWCASATPQRRLRRPRPCGSGEPSTRARSAAVAVASDALISRESAWARLLLRTTRLPGTHVRKVRVNRASRTRARSFRLACATGGSRRRKRRRLHPGEPARARSAPRE
jgi:hypothetical protein